MILFGPGGLIGNGKITSTLFFFKDWALENLFRDDSLSGECSKSSASSTVAKTAYFPNLVTTSSNGGM